jgi:hypothetical protein
MVKTKRDPMSGVHQHDGVRSREQENEMNYKLIGAVALSLMLASPAMAMHRGYHHHHAVKFGNSSIYGAYNFYSGHDYAPRDDYRGDFERSNTFN